jgi:Predicted integral membrane protein
MDYSFAVAVGLHSLAAVIWVGGMFFAHFVLRPATAEMTETLRFALWRRVLPRFFKWAGLSIVVLLTTGYGVLLTGYRGGILGGNLHIDIMQATGLAMILLYLYVVAGPFPSFRRALDRNDMAAAARAQGRIRHIVAINLVLGLVTTFIGAFGTFVGY